MAGITEAKITSVQNKKLKNKTGHGRTTVEGVEGDQVSGPIRTPTPIVPPSGGGSTENTNTGDNNRQVTGERGKKPALDQQQVRQIGWGWSPGYVELDRIRATHRSILRKTDASLVSFLHPEKRPTVKTTNTNKRVYIGKNNRRDERSYGRKQLGKGKHRAWSAAGPTRHRRAKGSQGSSLGRSDQGHGLVLRTRHTRLPTSSSVTRRARPNKQPRTKNRKHTRSKSQRDEGG